VVAIEVVRGDITSLEVDAIVNAANSSLMGGGGVDGAIHRAAGPSLLEECRAIVARQGGCPPGEAVMTGAGDLKATVVIHTVGPVWQPGEGDRLDPILASCYTTSLRLAADAGCRSIAFPNISTGVYGYPKDRAADVAVGAVRSLVAGRGGGSIERILFVCFDDDNAELYEARVAASG